MDGILPHDTLSSHVRVLWESQWSICWPTAPLHTHTIVPLARPLTGAVCVLAVNKTLGRLPTLTLRNTGISSGQASDGCCVLAVNKSPAPLSTRTLRIYPLIVRIGCRLQFHGPRLDSRPAIFSTENRSRGTRAEIDASARRKRRKRRNRRVSTSHDLSRGTKRGRSRDEKFGRCAFGARPHTRSARRAPTTTFFNKISRDLAYKQVT